MIRVFIPDPDPYFLPIPDPGVKMTQDPGSGSATQFALAIFGLKAAHQNIIHKMIILSRKF
jgi:hypothetical protein